MVCSRFDWPQAKICVFECLALKAPNAALHSNLCCLREVTACGSRHSLSIVKFVKELAAGTHPGHNDYRCDGCSFNVFVFESIQSMIIFVCSSLQT